MIKYTIPVCIEFTEYQLVRCVVVYATNELEAFDKASIFVSRHYCTRKGFKFCRFVRNCISSEPCITSFCD